MKKDVLEKVKMYVEELKKEYPIKKAILFGSYAKGNFNEYSDIDLAVVLGNDKIERTQMEVKFKIKAVKFDAKINPIVFTEEDFKDKSPLIWEIKKYGKSIV